jgi:hypothetical protein
MSFRGVPHVLEFSLGENFITHEGAEIIAESISNWQGALHNVELFNIRGNEIGDRGAKALAQVFQHHHCVRVVDVSSNRIRATGAMYFAQCVARCVDCWLLLLVVGCGFYWWFLFWCCLGLHDLPGTVSCLSLSLSLCVCVSVSSETRASSY